MTRTASGLTAAAMAALSETEFVVMIDGAHVTFERDEQGAVTGWCCASAATRPGGQAPLTAWQQRGSQR